LCDIDGGRGSQVKSPSDIYISLPQENLIFDKMISDKKLQEKIGWRPHKGQKEVLKAKGNEIIICAGRRWGKSAVSAYIVLKTFLDALDEIKEGKRASIQIWIVAPTYELTRKVFSYVVQWILKVDKGFSQYIHYTPNRPGDITVSEGIWIQCKSTETPDSLLGEEVDLMVVDEAATIQRKLLGSHIYPPVSGKTRKGKLIFISTPRGRNWFWEKFEELKGNAFHFKSTDGVEITEEKLEELRQKFPRAIIEQEYLAVFRSGADTVFNPRDVKSVIKDVPPTVTPGHFYIMGLDLAQSRDYSVAIVMSRQTNEMVYFQRWQKLPYPLQKEKIIDIAAVYKPKIIIDSLNVGAQMAQELRSVGLMVEDFKTTGTISKDWQKRGSKERMIERLVSFIEQKKISILPVDELIDELDTFGVNVSDSGNITYGAPAGLHDDCVMALAMAVWGLSNFVKREKTAIQKEWDRMKKRKNKSNYI